MSDHDEEPQQSHSQECVSISGQEEVEDNNDSDSSCSSIEVLEEEPQEEAGENVTVAISAAELCFLDTLSSTLKMKHGEERMKGQRTIFARSSPDRTSRTHGAADTEQAADTQQANGTEQAADTQQAADTEGVCGTEQASQTEGMLAELPELRLSTSSLWSMSAASISAEEIVSNSEVTCADSGSDVMRLLVSTEPDLLQSAGSPGATPQHHQEEQQQTGSQDEAGSPSAAVVGPDHDVRPWAEGMMVRARRGGRSRCEPDVRPWLSAHWGLAFSALLVLTVFAAGHWLGTTSWQWRRSQEAQQLYLDQLQVAVQELRQCLLDGDSLRQQAEAMLQRERAAHQKTVRTLWVQHQLLTRLLRDSQHQPKTNQSTNRQQPPQSETNQSTNHHQPHQSETNQSTNRHQPPQSDKDLPPRSFSTVHSQHQKKKDTAHRLYCYLKKEWGIEINIRSYLDYLSQGMNVSANYLSQTMNVSANYLSQTMNVSANYLIQTMNVSANYLSQGMNVSANYLSQTMNVSANYLSQGMNVSANYLSQTMNVSANYLSQTMNVSANYLSQTMNVSANYLSQTMNVSANYLSQTINVSANYLSQGMNVSANYLSQGMNVSANYLIQSMNVSANYLSQRVHASPYMSQSINASANALRYLKQASINLTESVRWYSWDQ
ncbi:hypothetical protein ACOMHN_004911 [Nucella lapillus]